MLGYPVSGIALFDEPPRVSIKLENFPRNGLLLGMVQYADDLAAGLVLFEDGSVTMLPLATFVLDWRYDAETDQWIDVSMPKPEQPDILT